MSGLMASRFVRFSEPVAVIEVKRPCSCGCVSDMVDGFEWEGEYFFTAQCLVNSMISEGMVKTFD